MKKRMDGFQKPLSNAKPESVLMACITLEPGIVSCSCGWAKAHPREKILGDSAERHVDKKHQGRALWM